jgi:HAAS
MTAADELTASYLRRLERELRGVPRGRRAEILEEVAAHLAEARAEAADEAELRTLIDHLGDPAEIAAEARGPVPRRGAAEIGALAMLSVGSLLPVLGWLVGAVLLWSSRVWTTRDKLVGTLLVPGGFFTSLMLLVGAASTCTSVSGTFRPGGGVQASTTCHGPGLVVQLLAVAAVVAPLVSVGYLAWRAHDRRDVASPMGAALPTA